MKGERFGNGREASAGMERLKRGVEAVNVEAAFLARHGVSVALRDMRAPGGAVPSYRILVRGKVK